MNLDPMNDPDRDEPELLECDSCGAAISVIPRGAIWPLCATCEQHEAERRYEQWLSDYYGSSQPTTVAEHYAAAADEQRKARG